MKLCIILLELAKQGEKQQQEKKDKKIVVVSKAESYATEWLQRARRVDKSEIYFVLKDEIENFIDEWQKHQEDFN